MNNDKPVVIVSGGSRGLGYGIVLALLKEGYFVETFSRKKTKQIEEVEQGDFAPFFQWNEVDGSSTKALNEFNHYIRNKHDCIYGLINNAGVAVEGVLPLTSEEDIAKAIHLNLMGTIHLTKHITKIMLRAKQGNVINISSIIGIRGYSGLSVYSATKAALDGFSRALARELGPCGIRVNAVAPGYMATAMSHGMSKSRLEQIRRRTPLGRLATVDDVVDCIVFLLSNKARFITGQTLVIDGGITC